MISIVRAYNLSRILILTQLRASRNNSGKSRIWERPLFILFADALAISISSLVSFEALSFMPPSSELLVDSVARQVLAFVPIFALAITILAGIMFELSASSRFASSDLINWLPIAKSEYVAASGASVAYMYSPYFCVAAGITLALSLNTFLMFAWAISFALSVVSLLVGGFIIEIIRASINRAYTAMSRRTSRATLIARLVLTILVIVAFESVFYPNFLFGIMNRFVGALDASIMIPLVWPSLAVSAVIARDMITSVLFGLLSLVFLVVVFALALAIRSKYWSPPPVSMSFSSKKGYAPQPSRLEFLGLSKTETTLISKDLKGYVRKKELLSFVAMPFVFAAILIIQRISIASSVGAPDLSWLGSWFAGFYALIISSSSIGMEGKSILNMYVLPLHFKQFVRAKAFSSGALSIGGALILSVVGAIFFSPNIPFFLRMFVTSLLVSIQSVFIGLSFATTSSDFAERPRPRYLTMSGMLSSMLVGSGAIFITMLPIMLVAQLPLTLSLLLSFISFCAISGIAYRRTMIGAKKLLTEMKD